MHALKAHVRNGRLVLDEPTDLPEGEIVELVPVDEFLVLDRNDGLDDEERERLHQSLRESPGDYSTPLRFISPPVTGKIRLERSTSALFMLY